MAGADAAMPGWYGKIPYLGDFASRRLSQPFIAVWDSWLQQSIGASRNQLGAGWLEAYLHSPIWRFMLLPGVIGDKIWAGLMMPSVDKVGRHFPLTIAVEVEPRAGVAVAVIAAREWYAELEEAALATLNTEFPVEQFEARLADLAFHEAAQHQPDNQTTQLTQWWLRPATHFDMALPLGYTVHHVVCAASAQLFQAAGAGKSLWWQEMQDASSSRLTCFNGLPDPDHFAMLLQVPDALAATLPINLRAAAGDTTPGLL